MPAPNGRSPSFTLVMIGWLAIVVLFGVLLGSAGINQRYLPLPSTVNGAGEISLDGAELAWSLVDLTVEGYLEVTFSDGVYLAAERIEGNPNAIPLSGRVWLSEDGRQWRELAPTPISAGTVPYGVTAHGGVVLAVGITRPEKGGAVPDVWRWSADAGWRETQLPKPRLLGADQVAYAQKLLAGPQGFIIAAMAVMFDGSETDYPPPLFLWWSADGTAWEAVESEFDVTDLATLVATGDGFVSAGWRSTDGATWTEVAPSSPAPEPMNIFGRWGSRLVSFSEKGLSISDDSGQYNGFGPEPLPESYYRRGAVGRFGVLIEERDGTTNLLFSADGQRWNRQAAVPLLGNYIHSIAVGNTEVIVATTSRTGTNQLWLGTLDQ